MAKPITTSTAWRMGFASAQPIRPRTKETQHRRVDKGGRGVTVEHGACPAVPTAALLVGTADLAPRINRTVGAAFAHPTDCRSCRRKHMIRTKETLKQKGYRRSDRRRFRRRWLDRRGPCYVALNLTVMDVCQPRALTLPSGPFFCHTARQSSRWIVGNVAVPKAVSMLLRPMAIGLYTRGSKPWC
jgi:hypothetical protein